MIKLPEGFDFKAAFAYIVPIEPTKLDFYQWGLNCRLIFNDNEDDATGLYCEEIENKGFSATQCTDFWEGYYYGVDNLLAKHPELVVDSMQAAIDAFEYNEQYEAADAGGGF